MDEVSQEDFDKTIEITPKLKNPPKELSEKELNKMLAEMENPVEEQKRLAVLIKTSLNIQIKRDLDKLGVLSDHTRRWVESYNSILEKIQKALHGDKSVNMHVHTVSHGDIAAKMREVTIKVKK